MKGRSLIALWASLVTWHGVASAQTLQEVLSTKGYDELAALKALRLPDALNRAVRNDLQQLPRHEAYVSIMDRLRSDLAARDVIDRRLISGQGGRNVRSVDALELQRDASRPFTSPSHFPRETGRLRDVMPDDLVLRTAQSVYQTTPGTPADEDLPSNRAGIGPLGSEVGLGSSPSQTFPGRAAPLTDCGVRFDQIAKTCAKPEKGQRCETFSRQQFGEVAKIRTPNGGTCTGTLVHPNWVLSAAHCFIDKPPSEYGSAFPDRLTPAKDAILRDEDLGKTSVWFPYANLKSEERRRAIRYVVVNRDWSPKAVIASGSTVLVDDTRIAADYIYRGDLALIRLSDEGGVPKAAATPARIPSGDTEGFITTAGYGFSTVGDGQEGELWVTWPSQPVVATQGQLELRLNGGPAVSTFCRGDSGGPAFAGRHRGCDAKIEPARSEAPRPRPLVGVVSYYYGKFSDQASALTAAEYCMAAPVMRFVSVTAPAHRQWICEVSGGEAAGC